MTLEMERQRHLQDDHMSGNWSLGSNYHPCSQSRKISIGVVVDSFAKMKGENGKGVLAELKTSNNVTLAKDVPAESKQKGKEVMPPDSGRQNKAPCRESSPLVPTKTSSRNISYSDTIGRPEKVSSLPSTTNVPLQPSGSKIAGEMEPDSLMHDANDKSSKKNTYQRDGITGMEKGSSYATAQKVPVPDPEQVTSERGNTEKATLRMKVQELLGTVYSPNKKQHDSETFGMDSQPKPKTIKSDSLVATHRQHPHTRETNSESRRPVTRSLTGKKPQAQKFAPKKQAPFWRYKQANLDENEFSFVGSWSRSPLTDGFTTHKRKEREIFGSRPVKKCFVEGVHKAKPAAVNGSNRSEIVKPNIFEAMLTRHQSGGTNRTMLHSNVVHDALKNNVYDLKSATFELKTTAVITSPISLFQTKQEHTDVDSQSERALKKTKGTHSIGSSKGGHYNANTKNFVTDSRDSPIVTPDGGHKQNRCSRSPSKEVQSEGGSPVTVPVILKNDHENRWSVSPCQEEDSESSEDDSPIKGNGDCDKFDDSDGLAGAVKLFTLALERVERKIHLSTSRQSAEILLSVSNNIHSQLQNAESKIENQVGKLTNLGKSKRMHPEKECQEQQEQLKRIYEKFKQQVDEHLDKCRGTLEGLEAHQMEVRGMVEKQRVSHRKLLLQTEEAIETQLDDAQRRLSDVHRLAREKILKLKHGIGECLKHGLLDT